MLRFRPNSPRDWQREERANIDRKDRKCCADALLREQPTCVEVNDYDVKKLLLLRRDGPFYKVNLREQNTGEILPAMHLAPERPMVACEGQQGSNFATFPGMPDGPRG